jgi:hypothetical protein
MPSVIPSPLIAEQANKDQNLSLIEFKFNASIISSAERALWMSCLLAKTRMGTFVNFGSFNSNES